MVHRGSTSELMQPNPKATRSTNDQRRETDMGYFGRVIEKLWIEGNIRIRLVQRARICS